MQKKLREEYIEPQIQTQTVKNPKPDFQDIDKVLHQMQLTYKANIEAQQTYLDILKCKNKNINSKYIKMIYALFTENKANQICFEKEQAMLRNIQFEDRLFRRYYARLIQMGIRKISYFWTNNVHLDFLSPYILKIAKQIHAIFNDIYKMRSLEQHFSVLKMLFHENAVIEQKIYALLIQEGYILSMDQFYRINGVDLVADRLYEAKTPKTTTPTYNQSEQFIESKKQSLKNIRLNKGTQQKQQKQNKKLWSYSKTPTQDQTQTFYNQTQSQKNRLKIKAMLQSMVKDLKTNFEQQKQMNNLPVIQQQSETIPKSRHASVHLEGEEQDIRVSNNSRARCPKPDSAYKRKLKEKKISIELMSYFSNQLKSAISEVQEADIDCLSDLLMTSQSNSKPIDKVFMKINQNQMTYIHSHKSLDSLKKIKEQKKRGKLLQMALKKRNFDSISQMYEELNQNYHLSFDASNSKKQKFSFRSAPGMYISLPKKQRQSNIKNSVKSDKKQQNPIKKLIIRQTFSKDPLFQNELIVNELAIHQLPCLMKKLNITEGNQSNLTFGIANNAYAAISNNQACRSMPKHINGRDTDVSKRQKQNLNDEKIHELNQRKPRSVLGNRIKNIMLTTITQNLNESNLESDKKQKITVKPIKQPNYVIYDRIRRRIILTK